MSITDQILIYIKSWSKRIVQNCQKMNLESEIMGNQNDKRYRVPNDIGVISSGEASENVSFTYFNLLKSI